MQVVSVNVGVPRRVTWNGLSLVTAIFKDAVDHAVAVRRLNLDGDRQANLAVHGGRNKAVYGYPSEHYEYWRGELPEMDLRWGNFGENLTTAGLDEESLCIGDRLQIGTAILVVTQPRIPCERLTFRFQRADMIKRFLLSGRSGFYFSVEKEGEVAAGSSIEFVSRDPNQVSVADANRLYIGRSSDPEILERALKVEALPIGWKEDLREKARARHAAGP